MANNKLSLLSDIMGVLRGAYIIHSHSAQIPQQRHIALQRSLTPNQRQQVEFERVQRDMRRQEGEKEIAQEKDEKQILKEDEPLVDKMAEQPLPQVEVEK